MTLGSGNEGESVGKDQLDPGKEESVEKGRKMPGFGSYSGLTADLSLVVSEFTSSGISHPRPPPPIYQHLEGVIS